MDMLTRKSRIKRFILCLRMGAFEKDGGHLDGEDSIIDSVKDTTMCTPGVST
jgi:hypothetical protein